MVARKLTSFIVDPLFPVDVGAGVVAERCIVVAKRTIRNRSEDLLEEKKQRDESLKQVGQKTYYIERVLLTCVCVCIFLWKAIVLHDLWRRFLKSRGLGEPRGEDGRIQRKADICYQTVSTSNYLHSLRH